MCTGSGVAPWEFLDAYIQLVEKSLVQRDVEAESVTGRSRYRMFETIRAFAAARLREAGEGAALGRAHVAYFVAQAEEAQTKISGTEQAVWVKRIDADHANHRHALAIALGTLPGEDRDIAPPDPLAGMRLAAALGEYWQIRGYYREAAEIYHTALARPESRETPEVRVRLLAWAGNIALARGLYDEARAHHEEGVAFCETIGNRRGLGSSINSLGVIAWREGDIRAARAHYARAAGIWRDIGEKRHTGITLNNLGVLDMETGDYASARTYYEQSLAIHEKLGNRHAVGVLQANVALAAMQLGAYDDAHAAFESSLAIRREIGDRAGIAHALNGLGSVLERRGEPAAARPLIEESLALYEEVGDRVATTVPLLNLGFIGLHLDDVDEAERSFQRAETLAGEAGDTANTARATAGLGMVDLARGRYAPASKRLREALAALQAVEDRWGVALVLEHIAPLFVHVGHPIAAARILGFLEAERTALHAPRTSLQEADYAKTMSSIASELPEPVLIEERERGASMTIAAILELVQSVEIADT